MLAVWTWCLIFASAILFVFYYLNSVFRRKRRDLEPPVVAGSLILGNASEFSQHAVDFLQSSKKRYGNVFTIRLLNQYLTIIMEPNSYETMSHEKNFDFDPIQKQVNWNVFSFVLKEPKKMIKDTGKTVRGQHMEVGMDNYVRNLELACVNVYENHVGARSGNEWATIGLRSFTAKTSFDAIFNSVFGRSDGHVFDADKAYSNFEIFHKYFNYFWLGLPKGFFPTAITALKELLLLPDADVLLARKDLSSYIRIAIEYMKKQGQTEADIKGHNLVYLHVNYNTFRLSFWALSNLLEDPVASKALLEEIQMMISERYDSESNTAEFSITDVENMKILDSVVQETCRLASGVFMVRYIKEDTMFKTCEGKEYLMRQGDRVAIYPPAIHKDPEIFEDPLVFKHDRFVDAKFYKDGQELKHPIMPFGSLCPGKRYAILQMKWYIMTIMTHFDLHLLDGQHAEYDYQYHGHEVLPPVKDVQVNFRPRENIPSLKLLHR